MVSMVHAEARLFWVARQLDGRLVRSLDPAPHRGIGGQALKRSSAEASLKQTTIAGAAAPRRIGEQTSRAVDSGPRSSVESIVVMVGVLLYSSGICATVIFLH